MDQEGCPNPPPRADLKAHSENVPKNPFSVLFGAKSSASKLWQQIEVHSAELWASR